MIKLSSCTTMLVRRDGRREPFDADALEARIVKSCLAAGEPDLWIAEDIALSVEHAMHTKAGDGCELMEHELDEMVSRILEDIGRLDAAREFASASCREGRKLDGMDGLSDLLSVRLGVEGDELARLCGRVSEGLEALGALEGWNPSLALELGRHFKISFVPGLKKGVISIAGDVERKGVLGGWLPQVFPSYANVSADLGWMLKEGAVSFKGVGTLFPALVAELRLEPLARHYGLSSPLTELALMPGLAQVSDIVEVACAEADSILSMRKYGQSNAPLWLALMDASSFARNWMGCDGMRIEPCVSVLAEAAVSGLCRKPFKTTWK